MKDDKEFTDEEIEEMSYQEKIDNGICPECGAKLIHRGGCIECENPDCWFTLCA